MEFERTRPFHGEPAQVIDLAFLLLAANGFEATAKGADFIEMHSVGMTSTKQSPVLGASVVRIEANTRQVRLRASLGGINQVRRLLLFLPLGLGLFFLVLFGALFPETGIGFILLVSLAPVAPWLVLAPWLNRWIRRRTEGALDGLLTNLVIAAESGKRKA